MRGWSVFYASFGKKSLLWSPWWLGVARLFDFIFQLIFYVKWFTYVLSFIPLLYTLDTPFIRQAIPAPPWPDYVPGLVPAGACFRGSACADRLYIYFPFLSVSAWVVAFFCSCGRGGGSWNRNVPLPHLHFPKQSSFVSEFGGDDKGNEMGPKGINLSSDHP